jgi:hypothetical protein
LRFPYTPVILTPRVVGEVRQIGDLLFLDGCS